MGKKKLTIIGSVPIIGGLVKPVLWIIERGGDLEFVVENWPGVLKILVAPWFPFVAFGIGGIILYLALRKPQQTRAKTGKTSEPKKGRPQLIHDGVLWVDNGNNVWGNLDIDGPLCPKDYTPLAQKREDKVDANLRSRALISDSGYHSQLICLECGGEYTLGLTPKMVQDSRDEV